MIAKLKTSATRYKQYLSNSSWIMAEKILNMGIAFFVTIFVARYLGPEQFGILSYAISLVALFASAGHMGLGGLVVREIVKRPDQRAETLGTTFGLKFLGFLIGFLLLIVFAFLTEEIGSTGFWVMIIVASSMLFQSSSVISFWFEAHVQAKYSSIANTLAVLMSSALKIALVFSGTGLLLFAFASVVQAAVIAVILVVFYHRFANISLSEWKVSFQRAKELLSQGWVIFLGSIFAVVYLKIDQIMLKWLVGAEEVGVYAVAASLSEAWYFVPVAIVASFFPRLIKLRESNEAQYSLRLQQLFDLLFILALIVAIAVTLFSKPIILLFFGEAYRDSAMILTIHIWAALFIFMRALFSKWILIEDALMFSLITQGFGALANVGFNLLLIPHYGGEGAAIATLISYAMASYVSLLFYKKSRPIFWMMSRAMIAPVRYPLVYLKGKK